MVAPKKRKKKKKGVVSSSEEKRKKGRKGRELRLKPKGGKEKEAFELHWQGRGKNRFPFK